MKNLNASYPGKSNAPDANYTYGSRRDVTTANDGTGTPWNADLGNDECGFFQALVDTAQITPSDNSETAIDSQLLRATQKLVQLMTAKQINTPVFEDNLSNRIGGIQTSKSLAAPYSTANRITGFDWRNVFAGYNAGLEQESVFLIRDNHATSIYEYYNRPKDFNAIAIERSITLPANHVPDSGCCDGTSVYLLCHTAASGTACAVHKFDISDWDATPEWSVTLTGAISLGNFITTRVSPLTFSS